MDRKRDYRYDLPPEQIAQRPADRRDGSRLLWLRGDDFRDRQFADLVEILPEGALLVANDTRVIKARLRARKPTGGAIELLFLEPVAGAGGGGVGQVWRCLARGKLEPGLRLQVAPELPPLVVVGERRRDATLTVSYPGDVAELLAACGEVPLPPYIGRPEGTTAADLDRYQTVYARAPGAVAAPTAGLHFTPELLAALERRGCELRFLTLHVGWGTFAPMREELLDRHVMHAEHYDIPEATAAAIESGRPVVAVGTTVIRALESAAVAPHRVRAGAAVTDLFIRPGFEFRAVDHLITNFHLPESTLLMMVCAFAGMARVLAAYRHAVAAGYRFYSYGDAMFLSRDGGAR